MNKRSYYISLALVMTTYVAFYCILLYASNGIPYVMDNNESFSAFFHARNIYEYGLHESFGLTDDCYAWHEKAHPHVYTHGINFPRFFSLILYALGARTIESHIFISAFTIGIMTVYLLFRFFLKTGGPVFATIASILFITDYIGYAQWHITTFHVWQGFFLFGCLYCSKNIINDGHLKWYIFNILLCFGTVAYEISFALFVILFNMLYVAFHLYHDPRRLMLAWSSQILGAVTVAVMLVTQLILYYGFDNLIVDFSLTFLGRNHGDIFTVDLEKVGEFFSSHNIGFWYNINNDNKIKTVSHFLNSIFLYGFDVYTPYYSLLILLLASSWAIHQFDRYIWKKSTNVGHRSYGNETELENPFHQWRGRLCLVLIFLSVLVLFNISISHTAILGELRGFNWFELVILNVLLLSAIAVFSLKTVLLLDSKSYNAYLLPVYRVLLASLFIVVVFWYFGIQTAIYDMSHAPVWTEMLRFFASRWISHFVLIVVILISVRLIISSSDWENKEEGFEIVSQGVPIYLICSFLAYAITYAFLPGYINSGYIYRYAPLQVFIIIPLFALAIYILIKQLLVELSCVRLQIQRTGGFSFFSLVKLRNGQSMRSRLRYSASVAGSKLLQVALYSLVVVFVIGYWLHMQLTYIELIPPTQISFLKRLSLPPYRGTSFISNNYPAPAAYMTGMWAYQGKRWLMPKEGLADYKVASDTRYLWVADKNTNEDYRMPDYYLFFSGPNYSTLINILRLKYSQENVPSIGFIHDELVNLALKPQQFELHHKILEKDDSPLHSWAIVKLDWSPAPYLKLLPYPSYKRAVNLKLSSLRQDSITLSVEYEYEDFNSHPENGTLVRLYELKENVAASHTDDALIIREEEGVRTVSLPRSYNGRVQVGVVPSSSMGKGLEYVSRIYRISSEGERVALTPEPLEYPLFGSSNLKDVLEKNAYGDVQNENLLADNGGALLFRASTDRDHVATPFFPVKWAPREIDLELQLQMTPPPQEMRSSDCLIVIQDQGYGKLLETPCYEADELEFPSSHSIKRYLQVPRRVEKVRVVFQSKDGRQTYIPSSLMVEQVSLGRLTLN